MSRWARRAADDAGLNEIETRYLEDLVPYLRTVPRQPRRRLIAEFVEVLSSRPASESLPELVAALGRPGDAADQLRSDNGLTGPISLWRRWKLQSHGWHAAQVLVLAALLAGVVAWRTYYGATPDFHNSCLGIAAPEIETLQAAGETEYATTWRERQRYGLMLCPFTFTSGVTIERVFVEVASGLAVQPVGWELDVERLASTWEGDASAHHPWRPEDVPWSGDVVVWLESEYCNFSSVKGFNAVQVEYTYRGRTRIATVDLGYTMTIDSADQCSDDRRALDDEATRRWQATVGDRMGGQWEGVGPLRLSPESTSRDLCRYLRGVVAAESRFANLEPLAARAVFQLGDRALAQTLIDGAVLGVCPEFAERRDELVAMLDA